jgi:hypothetical protein
MKSHISLTGVSAAIMLFAVTAAMHEAARADNLSQGYHQVAQRFAAQRGKKPLGLKGSGGTSHIQDNCQYGNDGITHCDDCDVDWDQTPPQKVCITNAICWKDDHRVDCPPLP